MARRRFSLSHRARQRARARNLEVGAERSELVCTKRDLSGGCIRWTRQSVQTYDPFTTARQARRAPPGSTLRSLGYSAGSGRRFGIPAHHHGIASDGKAIRPSPGYTAGATGVLHHTGRAEVSGPLEVGRRVPPAPRPSGRYSRKGVRYRYPGGRPVMVGKSDLVDVGGTKCVPCSQIARAARG